MFSAMKYLKNFYSSLPPHVALQALVNTSVTPIKCWLNTGPYDFLSQASPEHDLRGHQPWHVHFKPPFHLWNLIFIFVAVYFVAALCRACDAFSRKSLALINLVRAISFDGVT